MSKRKRERKSARTESFLRSLCRRDASILNLFIVLLELIARLRVGRAGFEFTTRLVPVSRLSSPVTGLSRWLSSACTFAVARVYEVACRDAFLKRQETPSCRVFRGGQWSPPPPLSPGSLSERPVIAVGRAGSRARYHYPSSVIPSDPRARIGNRDRGSSRYRERCRLA